MGDCFGKDRAWIELDMGALRHNVAALRALLPRLCADACGQSRCLWPRRGAYCAGAKPSWRKGFCVASAREGAQLRRSGVEGEILVLGYTHPRLIPLLYRSRLTQTVLDASYAECLNQAGLPLEVQIKIDTGMHRLGERWTQIDALERIFACRNLHVAGLLPICVPMKRRGRRTELTRSLKPGRFRMQSLPCASAAAGCPKCIALASYGLLNYPEIGVIMPVPVLRCTVC